MKKITLILISSIFLISCGESEEQKANNLKFEEASQENAEYSEEMAESKKSTNEDIALLKEYSAKENQNITDENGFRIRYEVKQSWDDVRELAISDTLIGYYKDSQSQTKYLKVLVGKSKYVLLKDDEPQKVVYLIAQIFVDGRIFKKDLNTQFPDAPQYFENEEHFFPEIDDKSKRNDIIEEFTSIQFFGGYSRANEFTELNHELTKEYTKTIKKSGVFDYNSLEDFPDK